MRRGDAARRRHLDALPRLTERYCVVRQTIASGPEVTVSRAVRQAA